MSEKKVCSIIEAEQKVKEFIKQKYVKTPNIHIGMTFSKGNFWFVKGDVTFKRLNSTFNVLFEAQVNMKNGKIFNYEEISLIDRLGTSCISRKGDVLCGF
jgi:hypothetical protein